jgi:hypothetical protein
VRVCLVCVLVRVRECIWCVCVFSVRALVWCRLAHLIVVHMFWKHVVAGLPGTPPRHLGDLHAHLIMIHTFWTYFVACIRVLIFFTISRGFWRTIHIHISGRRRPGASEVIPTAPGTLID